MSHPYTNHQKYHCVKREIEMRKRVYPRWIVTGKMGEQRAAQEIAIMESIERDYLAKLEAEEFTLEPETE